MTAVTTSKAGVRRFPCRPLMAGTDSAVVDPGDGCRRDRHRASGSRPEHHEPIRRSEKSEFVAPKQITGTPSNQVEVRERPTQSPATLDLRRSGTPFRGRGAVSRLKAAQQRWPLDGNGGRSPSQTSGYDGCCGAKCGHIATGIDRDEVVACAPLRPRRRYSHLASQ
jgi:hypothetical protein